MFNRVLISCLSLFWSVFACAEWTFVNANYDRSQFIYVDFNRVKVLDAKSNEVEYWVKYLIKNDKEKDGLELGDYSLALYRVGCDNEQYSIWQPNWRLILPACYKWSVIRVLHRPQSLVRVSTSYEIATKSVLKMLK